LKAKTERDNLSLLLSS
jgi:hypothetical protein